jgi:hypothetical protein
LCFNVYIKDLLGYDEKFQKMNTITTINSVFIAI